MTVQKTIYLASPLGFAQSTRAFMRELVERLRTVARVENPWEAEEFATAIATAEAIADRRQYVATLHAINLWIARQNEAAIRGSDLLVAVLDGVDVDSGTASEIGFAYGLGKTIFGLRTDFRLAGDNPGATVNLQVEYWIEASGGSLVTRLADLLAALPR